MRVNKSEQIDTKENTKKVSIVEIAYLFSLRIVRLVQTLPKETASFELVQQLIKSSTSITAHLEEARAAANRKDFMSKMNNALKEARKANLWLRLICDSKFIDSDTELQDLFQESRAIEKFLTILAKKP